MGFQGPPAADFYSQLSGLGDVIAKNRADQAKRDAFAQATMPGPEGTVDYGRAVLGLAQADPQAAALFASRQNHMDSLKQAETAAARQAARDKVTDSHWSSDYALRKAAEGRTAADYENTPDQYAPNPRAGEPGQPKFIDQYEAAKKAAEAAANGGQPEVGLQPAYGVGLDGKPAAIQFSKTGKALQTQLPDGFSLSKEPIKVDLGTHIQLIDPITRAPIGQPIPKNLAGVEVEKAKGEAQGAGIVGLPQALATAQQGIKTIEELKAHPGLDHSVGAWSVVPNIPGTAGADFNAKANQLKGQTFLQAYQTLRGSGAITDIEGKKGEDAIAALDRAQSKAAYVKALNDLKTVIEGGMLRAKAKAAGTTAAAPGEAATNRTASGVPWSIQ